MVMKLETLTVYRYGYASAAGGGGGGGGDLGDAIVERILKVFESGFVLHHFMTYQ